MSLTRNVKVGIVAASAVAALVAFQAPAEATVGAIHGPSCAGNGDYVTGKAVAFPASVTPGVHSCYYAQARIRAFNTSTGIDAWFTGQISHYEAYEAIANGDIIEAYQGRVADTAGTWGPWTNLVHE